MMRTTRALLLCALVAGRAHAAVPQRHPEPAMPTGWRTELSSAEGLGSIAFKLSLNQGGMDAVRAMAFKVSDPSDAAYGKHLNQSEIDAITAPTQQDERAVRDWVEAQPGCAVTSVLREVVKVACTSSSASSLLSTTFRSVVNPTTGQKTFRASTFELPRSVSAAVSAVYNLHGLPLPPRNSSARPSSSGVNPPDVTPQIIASTYGVSGVTPSGNETNRQAVAEFQPGQTMDPKDLVEFFSKYVPSAKPGEDTVSKFVGDPGTGSAGVEASLDIQYIMGVAPGVKTEFWYFKSNDFCADLKTWTQLILSTDNAPLVHSVSYGWQGNLTQVGCTDSNVADVDADFSKLAAKGITIIFASGDSGSGWTPPHPHCNSVPGTKGEVLEGTVKMNRIAHTSAQCCQFTAELSGKGYTYLGPGAGPGPAYCAKQRTKNIVLEGDGQIYNLHSANACCDIAQGPSLDLKGWTFVPGAAGSTLGNCTLMKTITGSRAGPAGSESLKGVPTPLALGNCTIFSTVTGKKTGVANATSDAATAPATVKLYPSWPASSPWVTSVGATRFQGQLVGNAEMASDQFGSGGGFSTMFDAIDSQKADVAAYLKSAPQLPPSGSFPPGGRATPDVSALGEGFVVLTGGRAQPVSGTSASTPLFAGLVSLLNDARMAAGKPALGYLNPWVYANPSLFTDVTVGTNAIGRITGPIPYGFNCTAGWDPATGLGTPIFAAMLRAALK